MKSGVEVYIKPEIIKIKAEIAEKIGETRKKILNIDSKNIFSHEAIEQDSRNNEKSLQDFLKVELVKLDELKKSVERLHLNEENKNILEEIQRFEGDIKVLSNQAYPYFYYMVAISHVEFDIEQKLIEIQQTGRIKFETEEDVATLVQGYKDFMNKVQSDFNTSHLTSVYSKNIESKIRNFRDAIEKFEQDYQVRFMSYEEQINKIAQELKALSEAKKNAQARGGMTNAEFIKKVNEKESQLADISKKFDKKFPRKYTNELKKRIAKCQEEIKEDKNAALIAVAPEEIKEFLKNTNQIKQSLTNLQNTGKATENDKIAIRKAKQTYINFENFYIKGKVQGKNRVVKNIAELIPKGNDKNEDEVNLKNYNDLLADSLRECKAAVSSAEKWQSKWSFSKTFDFLGNSRDSKKTSGEVTTATNPASEEEIVTKTPEAVRGMSKEPAKPLPQIPNPKNRGR